MHQGFTVWSCRQRTGNNLIPLEDANGNFGIEATRLSWAKKPIVAPKRRGEIGCGYAGDLEIIEEGKQGQEDIHSHRDSIADLL